MTESCETYAASTELPVGIEQAFAYHERRGALERLTPPWESVSITHTDGSIEVGSEVDLRVRLPLGIPITWKARHTELDPPHLFADEQISGPFAKWTHRHGFEVSGDDLTTLTDQISYQLPFGFLGKWFGRSMARKKIESMFAYRHQVTQDDLSLLNQYPKDQSLKVAISGASGLVGSSLGRVLELLGHQVSALVRSESADSVFPGIAPWSSDYDPNQTLWSRCRCASGGKTNCIQSLVATGEEGDSRQSYREDARVVYEAGIASVETQGTHLRFSNRKFMVIEATRF